MQHYVNYTFSILNNIGFHQLLCLSIRHTFLAYLPSPLDSSFFIHSLFLCNIDKHLFHNHSNPKPEVLPLTPQLITIPPLPASFPQNHPISLLPAHIFRATRSSRYWLNAVSFYLWFCYLYEFLLIMLYLSWQSSSFFYPTISSMFSAAYICSSCSSDVGCIFVTSICSGSPVILSTSARLSSQTSAKDWQSI